MNAPRSSSEMPASQDATVASHPPHASTVESVGLMTPLILFLVVLLVLGSIFIYITHTSFPVFTPADELLQMFPPPEIAIAREEAFSRYRLLNTLLCMSGLVIAASLLLGASEAKYRRERRHWARVIPGVLVAWSVTAVGIAAAHGVAEIHVPARSPLSLSQNFLSQALLWSGFGVGLGLGLGVVAGNGRTLRRLADWGLRVGLISAVVFVLVAGALLPDSHTFHIVPGGVLWGGKDLGILLAWTAVPMVLLGVMLPIGSRRARTTKRRGVERDSSGSLPAEPASGTD